VVTICRLRLKCDGTCAETRFRLSTRGTSPFKSAGASVQSTTGSRGVRISGSNAGYTMFRGSVRVLATNSIRQFPLQFTSRKSQCAITFQLDSTTSLTFTNSTLCPHSVFTCFVSIWEQTAIISLYSINWLVFITMTVSVYCAVRAECWTIIKVNISPQIVNEF
jgi:hypothetical protein